MQELQHSHLMHSEAAKELFIKPSDTDSFTAKVTK